MHILTALRSLLFHSVGNILYRITSLVLLALYADAVGADGIGKLEKFIALSLLLAPLVSLQLQDATMSAMAKGGASPVGTAASLLLASTALFAIALFAFTLCTNSMPTHVAAALFAHVTTGVYWNFARNILRTRGELRRLSLSESMQAFSSLLAAAGFIQADQDFSSALTAAAVGNLVALFISGTRDHPPPAKHAFIEQGRLLLSISSKLLPNMILWWGIEASDRWIYSMHASDTEIGIYSAGARIAGIGMAAALLVYQSWQTFGIHRVNASPSGGNFFQKSFEWYSLATALCFSAVISVAPKLCSIAFSPEFDDSAKYAVALTPGLYLAGASYFFGIIYFSAHSTAHAWKSGMAGMIASVCTNFALAPTIGIAGAPIASFLAFALVAGLRYRQGSKELGLALTTANFYAPLAVLTAQALMTLASANPAIILAGIPAILAINRRLVGSVLAEISLRIR